MGGLLRGGCGGGEVWRWWVALLVIYRCVMVGIPYSSITFGFCFYIIFHTPRGHCSRILGSCRPFFTALRPLPPPAPDFPVAQGDGSLRPDGGGEEMADGSLRLFENERLRFG